MAYKGKHETPTKYSAPNKNKRSGISLRLIIRSAAIIGLMVTGFLIARHIWQEHRSDRLNAQLQQAVESAVPAATPELKNEEKASATPKPIPDPELSSVPESTAEPNPEPTATASPSPRPETAPIRVDFDSLLAQNEDTIGWLYCEGTPINYAIVRRENDNDYYLNHLFSGESNEKGTIFADKRNKTPFEEWNTVLYGHNMKDGSMFGIIDEYGEQEFYEAHPVMYLLTPEKDYKVEICSAFLTGLASTTFEFPRTVGNPAKTIDDIEKYSYIETGIVPTTEDKLLSFSTCYEQNDHRYVVIGILRELERTEDGQT